MKLLLASLYKESMDRLLIMRPRGLVSEQYIISELTAEARVYAQLFNLPQVIKGLEEEFENQRLKKQAFSEAQEGGDLGLGGETNRRKGTTPILVEPGTSLADTLKARKDRMAQAERSS